MKCLCTPFKPWEGVTFLLSTISERAFTPLSYLVNPSHSTRSSFVNSDNMNLFRLLIEEIEHYLQSDAPKSSEIVMEVGIKALNRLVAS